MYCQNYSELFINTFIQTVAQLSAVLVSGSLAVPVYNYYIKSNNIKNDIVNKDNIRDDNDNSDTINNSVTEDTDDTEDDDVFRRQGDFDSNNPSVGVDYSHHQQFRMEEPDIVNH
jgi:hypothetical protein